MSDATTPGLEQARAAALWLLARIKAGVMTQDEATLILRDAYPDFAA